jgi:glycosyltransferase involved in cell wall biosynthesis
MPRVSVIIPNYNHARFLHRRLESVLNQTFTDLEVIFLDDASTDDSLRVFEPFTADPRVRALFNARNSGSTFRQWARGVGEATGELIWIAESDDYADPRLLERLVARLDRHPDVGLAYCQSWQVDGDGNRLCSVLKWTDWLDAQHWRSSFVNDGRDEITRYLIYQNTVPNASAVVFRRSLFEQVGGPDEGFGLCGDWLFWIKLALTSNVAFTAEHLNYWREHSHTVRAGGSRSGLYQAEVYRVLAYVLSRMALPPDVRERVFQHNYEWFMQAVHLRALPGDRRWRITQVAQKVDQRLHRRVLRDSLLRYPRKAYRVLRNIIGTASSSRAHLRRALARGPGRAAQAGRP